MEWRGVPFDEAGDELECAQHQARQPALRYLRLRRRVRLSALQRCMSPWLLLARCVRHRRRAVLGQALRGWGTYCALLDGFFDRARRMGLLHGWSLPHSNDWAAETLVITTHGMSAISMWCVSAPGLKKQSGAIASGYAQL